MFATHMPKCDYDDDAITSAAPLQKNKINPKPKSNITGGPLQDSVFHMTFNALTFDWQRMINQRSVSVRETRSGRASSPQHKTVLRGEWQNPLRKVKSSASLICILLSAVSLVRRVFVCFLSTRPLFHTTEPGREAESASWSLCADVT